MLQFFCNALKLSLAFLGAALLLSCRTSAQTVSAGKLILDQTGSAIILNTSPNETIETISQNTSAATEPMATITSVSQLSDVQPTDWAYTALQSLVERYGVIAGYPDETFRGKRAITRYEFAAGLNAVMNRVNELTTSGLAAKVSREDLVRLQKLQQEFEAELATLRGRVDSIEAATSELAANQFSTTTKLGGRLIFAANGGTIVGDREERPDPNATAFSYGLLNFESSFNGSDLLFTQLVIGSGGEQDEATKVTSALLSFLDYSGIDTDVLLRRLYYSVPLSNDLTASVFLRANASDYVDFNNYANNSFADFSTSLFLYNLLLMAGDPTASGVALTWNPKQGPLTLKAFYRADAAAEPGSRTTDTTEPDPNVTDEFFDTSTIGQDNTGGIFGGPNLAIFEAEFAPSKSFVFRAAYSFGTQDGAGYSVIAGNFEFAPFQGLALFGRFGHAFDYTDVLEVGVTDNNAHPNYWMAGIAFPDLFIEGAMAGVAVGQPFVEDSVGDVTQLNVEVFYRFPLTDQIALTPLVQVITNPGNSSNNGTLYTGTVRLFFTF
jgi:porin